MRTTQILLVVGTLLVVMFGLVGCMAGYSQGMAGIDIPRPTFDAVQANTSAYVGQRVLWGGVIQMVTSSDIGTEITVAQTWLDSRDAPFNTKYSNGKFIIRTRRAIDDMAMYKPDAVITVVGEIEGSKSKPQGDQDYAFPIVGMDRITFWVKREASSPTYCENMSAIHAGPIYAESDPYAKHCDETGLYYDSISTESPIGPIY